MLITYSATLTKKTTLNEDVYYLSCTLPSDKTWTYEAGQYMIFHVPTDDKMRPLRRLYSIASSPTNKNTVDFIIEMVPDGIGSKYIQELAVNDIVTLQGPAGVFTYKPSTRNPIFLATGTGIAPMYSIITDLIVQKSNKQLQLFWGMKYKKDLYLIDELAALAKQSNTFTYSVCLSREKDVDDTSCILGRVTDGLTNLTSNFSNFDYYLCGGKEMVESLRSFLLEHNVPKEQVYFEKFT